MLLLEFGMNLAVMVLLGFTIGYCWLLNRRIRVLQDSRSELAELLHHFDESTRRASDSIVALQQASKKIGETMQSRIEKASYIADDLAALLERSQQAAAKADAPKPAPAAKPTMEQKRATLEERAAELKAVNRQQRNLPQDGEQGRSRAIASLQAMLEKLAARGSSDPALRAPRPGIQAPPTAKASAAGPRSRAEQELIDVLKTGTKV
jgi:hypothetical protein